MAIDTILEQTKDINDLLSVRYVKFWVDTDALEAFHRECLSSAEQFMRNIVDNIKKGIMDLDELKAMSDMLKNKSLLTYMDEDLLWAAKEALSDKEVVDGPYDYDEWRAEDVSDRMLAFE